MSLLIGYLNRWQRNGHRQLLRFYKSEFLNNRTALCKAQDIHDAVLVFVVVMGFLLLHRQRTGGL